MLGDSFYVTGYCNQRRPSWVVTNCELVTGTPPPVTKVPPWNRGSPALRERGFSNGLLSIRGLAPLFP
jgi:hypothetical protein